MEERLKTIVIINYKRRNEASFIPTWEGEFPSTQSLLGRIMSPQSRNFAEAQHCIHFNASSGNLKQRERAKSPVIYAGVLVANMSLIGASLWIISTIHSWGTQWQNSHIYPQTLILQMAIRKCNFRIWYKFPSLASAMHFACALC